MIDDANILTHRKKKIETCKFVQMNRNIGTCVCVDESVGDTPWVTSKEDPERYQLCHQRTIEPSVSVSLMSYHGLRPHVNPCQTCRPCIFALGSCRDPPISESRERYVIVFIYLSAFFTIGWEYDTVVRKYARSNEYVWMLIYSWNTFGKSILKIRTKTKVGM